MNSAIAVTLGLVVAIVLIVKKCSPVYALLLGAVTGGLLSGWGLEVTVKEMFNGVKDLTPAIVRILAAGVLTGVLVKTGAASRIAISTVSKLGSRQAYLALALSAMILTGIGVFIDVAVITIAPVAMMVGKKLHLSRTKLLLAMIGGGKCGNIISPNPNTIVAAENFDAPLSSVMLAGVVPALLTLLVVVFVIVPIMPERDLMEGDSVGIDEEKLPSFIASIAGPAAAILLLAFRPLFGIVVDPMIALPVGGIVGLIASRRWRDTGESLGYGLSKMSGIAVLLVGTGTVAGVIKASAIKDVLIGLLSGWENGALLMAPVSGILMCVASASTTAGATIASATFAQTILAAGVNAVWAASMTNAGATVLDHLPHGSFFHATGGAVGMDVKQRLRLIPYESLAGLSLTIFSVLFYLFLLHCGLCQV